MNPWRPGRDRHAVRHPASPSRIGDGGGGGARPTVVVVGGGIAGLAAATGLAERGVVIRNNASVFFAPSGAREVAPPLHAEIGKHRAKALPEEKRGLIPSRMRRFPPDGIASGSQTNL